MPWGSSLFPLLIVTASGKFTGLFVYSPGPGNGNLIASIAAQAGTDPFGNPYQSGVVSYKPGAAGIFAQLLTAEINFGDPANVFGGSIVETPATGGASGVPGILLTSPSNLSVGTNDSQAALGIVGESADGTVKPYIYAGASQFGSSAIEPGQLIVAGDLGFSKAGVAGGLIRTDIGAIIAPTGDTTGAKDLAKINGLFNLGVKWITCLPGTYYINAPIIMDKDDQHLRGAGYGFKTVIVSAATTAQTAMIIAGNTVVTQHADIRDLALQGNLTAQTFTATNASPCVFTVGSGSAPANSTPISLWGNSLPAGFTQGTVYFVVASSGTTFELAATIGGAALNSTSTGSGTAVVALSGHGILWRSEAGTIKDVIVQKVSGDAFHVSTGDLSGATFDSLVMENCYAQFPAGDGLFIDQFMTSSEIIACHFAGGSLLTVPTGNHGINNGANGNIKFIACHPFNWPNGGMLLNGSRRVQVIGGEYETNPAPGIDVTGSSTNVKIIGPAFYGGTGGNDIFLRGGSSYIEVADCDFFSLVARNIELVGVQNVTLRHNRFSNTSASSHGIQCDTATPASKFIDIDGNVINTAPAVAAIQLANSVNCRVRKNAILSTATIVDQAGANNNLIDGNDLTSGGTITLVGANDKAVNNLGYNPVGKIASPPAVAASGTAVTNSTGVDCMVIVTLNATPNATSIAIGGNATGITSSVASAVLPPVRVPAGQTITLTYTGAPTWAWFGD